jgi:hypothetical protein
VIRRSGVLAIIRVPVDTSWVQRMVEIADAPWSEENLIATFERFGWTGGVMRSEDGTPWLPWCDWADLLPEERGEKEYSGWTMHLFEPGPAAEDDETLATGIALFCGSFWPSYDPDEEEEEADDFSAADRDGFVDSASSRAVWSVDAEARRDDFVAEFTRVEALVRDVCGEPTATIRRDAGAATIWDRGATGLSLMISPNDLNYGVDDWISLRVIPVP